MKTFIKILPGIFFLLLSCKKSTAPQNGDALYNNNEFKNYWYEGKAELNSYDLDQARYGENHKGEAVLIFVTEGFSKSKQVKLDDPEKAGSDKVTVMKLNFTKKFITGIYPYSMMLSAFTPVSRDQFPNTLKTTMTSQEWCGHVFSQLNLRDNQYTVDSYSYFEKEGDHHFTINKTFLEDEIWNMIRINHTSLPEGNVQILPGLFFTRLKHEDLKPLTGTASKVESDTAYAYSVRYTNPDRMLSITFEKTFPFKILSWTEEFKERDGHIMKTTATLKRTLYTDYWQKNKNEFRVLRDSLDLDQNH